MKLRDYQIVSVSTGEDAQGEVSIEVEHATGVYRGRALSTDIVEGSARVPRRREPHRTEEHAGGR